MSTKPIYLWGVGRHLCVGKGVRAHIRDVMALLFRTSSFSSTEGKRLPLVTCRDLLVSPILRVFLVNDFCRVGSERSHKNLTTVYQMA